MSSSHLVVEHVIQLHQGVPCLRQGGWHVVPSLRYCIIWIAKYARVRWCRAAIWWLCRLTAAGAPGGFGACDADHRQPPKHPADRCRGTKGPPIREGASLSSAVRKQAQFVQEPTQIPNHIFTTPTLSIYPPSLVFWLRTVCCPHTCGTWQNSGAQLPVQLWQSACYYRDSMASTGVSSC